MSMENLGPYSNFHELNQDWFLNEFNKIIDQCKTIQKSVDDIQNYFENLNVQDEINKKLDDMASSGELGDIIMAELTAVNSNGIIFIGDSYLEGYTPDGNVKSWGQQVKRLLDISDDDYYEFYHGGYGFTTGTAGFDKLADDAITSIGDNSKNIKTIIIGGGYNDANSVSNIRNNMQVTLTKLKSAFPNANILVAPIGWICQGKTTGVHVNQKFANLIEMVEAYQIGALENGCGFIPNIWCALHNNDLFSSDFVHPNSNGQYNIALMITEFLKGNCNVNYPYLKKISLKADLADGVTGNIQGNYTIDGENTFITISTLDIKLSVDSLKCSGVRVKLGKFISAGVYGNNNISFQTCAIIGSNNSKRWDALPCTINIINQEIFISFQGTTDDKSNFLTLTNVKSIAVYGLITSVTTNLIQ